MKTLAVDFLLKESPNAIAIVDTKLNFISYSNQWHQTFSLNKTDNFNKNLFNSIIETPELFKTAVNEGLNGKEHENNGQKFILPNGKLQWLKWKIIPSKIENQGFDGAIIFLEDITTGQKELELLHKAEEVARIGCWELDLINNTVHWTKTTKDIHEVDQDFVPNLEEGIDFYKEGIHRDKITYLVSTAIAEGKPFDTELIIITAKGNEVWVCAKGEVEILNGKTVRLVGTFQDIDERKKIELAHQEISERLKITTQTAQIGTWDYDLIAKNLKWDNEMYRIFDVKENQFSGAFEAWSSTIHPKDKDRVLLATKKAIEGIKDFDEEFRIVHQNGYIRHIRGLSKTIKGLNGKPVKMTGANWDITELRSAELKLARSTKSFTETFEHSAIGMALVGSDLKWLKVNKSLCHSLGYSEDELLKIKTTDITHPDDLPNSKTFKTKVFNGKNRNLHIQKRYFHKNGNIVHAIIGVTPVKDDNGKPSHAITQFLDITSRIESQKKLEGLVEVTKSQNESLTNFAHIVSHNLRSHSTNMTMLTKFLNEEEDEDERKNLNKMMVSATESLSETIAHLNDVVQVKTGALEKSQSISVLNTINQITKSINGILEKQSAILKIDVSKTHFVNAVPAYLESIFLNILTNALKYSSPERTPLIEIESKLKNDHVLITFTDNGQGIDLERHGKNIFGMYKTFHSHKDAKGIGLFITKNQVESMSGSINIKSEVDKGTTMFIKLKQG
ncbi:PAS domain S-box-containing protein [Maribacter caenipelagi]|uniref:histidine kinase n=1 Tax=Maribacter caenipelagi TaxID=1447781 RepID=A0A4R7CYA5_9FLAO|nr:PAS domain-containing sensor histidine kinase [Maribacter caenipelagi]TDS12721.1 PAS domain S-box-containing protein [Maribacter caenipelagi]